MSNPVRIQRSRQHKQISPNGLPIIYVGRPGKWGNPFRVVKEKGLWVVVNDENYGLKMVDTQSEALGYCMEFYKDYVLHEISLGVIDISNLTGKNISCWCKIGNPCHADILLGLANKKNVFGVIKL